MPKQMKLVFTTDDCYFVLDGARSAYRKGHSRWWGVGHRKFSAGCSLFPVLYTGPIFRRSRPSQQLLGSVLLPSEVEQRFGGRRDVVVGPRNEVKLCDGACLVRLQVLEVETANDVILTPNVLGHQMNLLTHHRATATTAVNHQ